MIVSVTRLRLISLWSFPTFFWHAMASTRQIRRAPGFIGGWLGGEDAYGQWTATVWESETAMRAFRNSAAHLRAMPRLIDWCDEASFAHWEQDSADVPTADVAYERMAQSGRLSKVRRPSARHVAGQRVGDKRPRSGPILRPKYAGDDFPSRPPSKQQEAEMTLTTYLNFGGNCEEAFRFYEQELGGKINFLMRHGETPGGSPAPDDWKNKVLHAQMSLGGTSLLGADVGPDRFQPMRSAYLTLTFDDTAATERVYTVLSEGGDIFMPMDETFFAHRFAMLRDRFGTSWMLLNPKPMQP